MAAKPPPPPVPPDADLRDFKDMPLEVGRLRDSDGLDDMTGDEFRCAVMLWAAAWHQVPAGSLPDDDRKLAKLAGLGRDLRAWKRVKEGAIHGFVRCSDARIYHPVVCEKVLECLDRQRKGRSAAMKRWQTERRSDAARIDQPIEKPEDPECGRMEPGIANGHDPSMGSGNARPMPGEERIREDKNLPPPPDSSTEPRATSLSDEVVVEVMDLLEAADPAWATRSGALVRAWLAEGADAREHILPVIQQGIDRGMASKINTLSYFTPAIRRRTEDRPVVDRRPAEQAPRHRALDRAKAAGDDDFADKISVVLRDHGAEAADRLGTDYLEKSHAAAQEA